jgi:hypothetical protein
MASAAKGTPGLLADLAPELGAAPYARNISLAVPLCAVLGVRDVSARMNSLAALKGATFGLICRTHAPVHVIQGLDCFDLPSTVR